MAPITFCGKMIFCTLLGNLKIHKEERSAKKNFSELLSICSSYKTVII